MRLSKRAHAALDVLRDEAEGNPAASSALASVEKSLGAKTGSEGRDTPGQQSAKRALAEKVSDSPAGDEASSKDSGDVPEVKVEVNTPTDGATAKANFMELLKSRRGTARKGK